MKTTEMIKTPMKSTLKNRVLALILGIGLMGAMGRAQAQLLVTLDPLSSQAIQGQTTMILYTATFTNQFGFDLYLNSGFGSVDSPLSLDSTLFDSFFVFPT